MNNLTIIGCAEWCSFDGFDIPAIKARVDSGAKTSSIQANNITLFNKETEKWVSFEVFPIQQNKSISITCEAKIYAKRLVKSSMGISEKRLVIKAPITIADLTYDIELTLANNRDAMEFRMLLGREALNKRYLIDTSETFLLSKFTQEDLDKKYTDYKKELVLNDSNLIVKPTKKN